MPQSLKRPFALAGLTIWCVCVPMVCPAETIVFRSGKRLHVDDVGEAETHITFLLHGLKAKVDKSVVGRVDGSGDSRVLAELPAASGRPEGVHSPGMQTILRDGTEADDTHPFIPLAPPAIAGDRPTTDPLGACAQVGRGNVSTDHRPVDPPGLWRPDGFSDLAWGAPMTAGGVFEPVTGNYDRAAVNEYYRPQDPRRIGAVNIEAIRYAFWRDRFYAVTLWTRGRDDFDVLRSIVFNQFGRGETCVTDGETYSWSTRLTDRMLTYRPAGELGTLWMRSKKLDRQYKLSRMHTPLQYLNALNSSYRSGPDSPRLPE